MSHDAEEMVAGGGATTKLFVNVWIGLLVLTGLEVFLAYEQFAVLIMLTALVGISIVKAVMIIAYFMHLKFERLSLFLSLFPILIMCIILMLVLFLPDSMRLEQMRMQ